MLCRHYADQIIRRCVLEEEIEAILKHCHNMECSGNFRGSRTTTKVLQSGFCWSVLFKDAHAL